MVFFFAHKSQRFLRNHDFKWISLDYAFIFEMFVCHVRLFVVIFGRKVLCLAS